MQLSLRFDPHPTLPELRARLKAALGPFPYDAPLAPIDQLIKSMLSARTQDVASWRAYERLKVGFPSWRAVLEAPTGEIEPILGMVTHPQSKTLWLRKTLQRILDLRGDFDLDFLGEMPVEQAMAWLQRLDGVGPHVAAAVLNFSTLRRPAMVVDTHVWRVARRYGLAGGRADPDAVRRIVMQEAPEDWRTEDYYELHWLMKSLGQTFCADQRMRCGGCPLSRQCATRLVGAERVAA